MNTHTGSMPPASRLMWPFRFVWRRATAYADRVGIMRTLVLGTVLAVVGYILMASIIGALIGIPMFLVGLLLLARGLY